MRDPSRRLQPKALCSATVTFLHYISSCLARERPRATGQWKTFCHLRKSPHLSPRRPQLRPASLAVRVTGMFYPRTQSVESPILTDPAQVTIRRSRRLRPLVSRTLQTQSPVPSARGVYLHSQQSEMSIRDRKSVV